KPPKVPSKGLGACIRLSLTSKPTLPREFALSLCFQKISPPLLDRLRACHRGHQSASGIAYLGEIDRIPPVAFPFGPQADPYGMACAGFPKIGTLYSSFDGKPRCRKFRPPSYFGSQANAKKMSDTSS
ncbi:unnamed protein product, partial [Ectocarpus sp. 12 AP-2014]